MTFRPPVPAPPSQPLGIRQFLRAVRTNALTMWPQEAYRQDCVASRFLGRTTLLLNAPDAVRHVLVANAANYRRSRASVRILRPVAGQGLLLSEGEAWKLQRRTVAPALGPRAMPVLARHVLAATNAAVAALRSNAILPVDLLAAMQDLALDIAGRSMFSLETRRHGPEMRRLLTDFADRHARPGLLDMLLPPGVPTPGDIGRLRFRLRWTALMDQVLDQRLRDPPPDSPATSWTCCAPPATRKPARASPPRNCATRPRP